MPSPDATPSLSIAADPVAPGLGLGLGLFADEQYTVGLFQRLKPAVVHIASLSINRHSGMQPLLNPEHMPRNFGSGFIWSADPVTGVAQIVTNYHVSDSW